MKIDGKLIIEDKNNRPTFRSVLLLGALSSYCDKAKAAGNKDEADITKVASAGKEFVDRLEEQFKRIVEGRAVELIKERFAKIEDMLYTLEGQVKCAATRR